MSKFCTRIPVQAGVPLLAGLLVAIAATGCERAEIADEPEVAEPSAQNVEDGAIAQDVGDIGEVDFQSSCNDEAQANFEVGLGLLHHMWYERALDAFEAAVDADPDCAMGHWGVAMTHYRPLWYPPDEQAVQAGTEAVEQAQQLEATEREQAFIDAIDGFFDNYDPDDHQQHAEAFRDGWQEAHERDSDDIEATSFYALGILATAPPATEDYEEQRRAGELMEQVLDEEPRHPAGHHYFLHAHDVRPLAAEAEEVARDYSDIAPAVPHALHMPAHIFVRLGEWDDVITWDTRAAEVGAQQRVDGRTPMDFYHSLDYVVYAYLQQGLDDEARDTARWFEDIQDPAQVLTAAYPAVAIPARIALEQRDWEQASDIAPLHADEFTWGDWPVVQLVEHTVQATGATFGDNADRTRQEFERVDELNDVLAEQDDPHWAPHAQAYRDFAEALVEYSDGNTDDAIAMMGDVADFQDSFDKHPTMPGRVIEAREYLGMLLYEDGQFETALQAYEQALELTPNRFHLYYGAAISAREADQPEVAADYFEALLELADPDQVDRPEVEEAQQFLDDAGPGI